MRELRRYEPQLYSIRIDGDHASAVERRALLLALAAPTLTGWGFALIIGLAVVVADLAVFEWIGLRRMATQ